MMIGGLLLIVNSSVAQRSSASSARIASEFGAFASASQAIKEKTEQFVISKNDDDLKVREDHIRSLNDQVRLQRKIDLEQTDLTRKLIMGSAVLLILFLVFIYLACRHRTSVKLQLAAQRLIINQKNESMMHLVSRNDQLASEKEWLMKEIHHRVKNNLQIVISLLSTQSKYLDNDVAYNAVRESQHRMQSISLIYQKLYQSENLALVDIRSYTVELIDYLRESFATEQRIAFDVDIALIQMDVTRAVPIGLILNEAITNAIKYAFPDDRSGKIGIFLRDSGENNLLLKIHDNGVGLPVSVDIQQRRSLGMTLMRGLSKQLNGSFEITDRDGMTITVDFVKEDLLKAV